MATSSPQREEPVWLVKDKIDEYKFCEELLQEEPMICIHDNFFTVDGKVTDLGKLRNRILTKISPYIRHGLSRKTSALLDVLRDRCYSDPLPVCQDRIHVANGTLYLDGRFETEKEFCLNRLPVAYHPDAPRPERWLRFVEELLYPEDIPTLQEYMGYCLIPSTRAQKMLLLVGKGGEGKSRIGVVLAAMLGQSMYSGSIAKVETSAFARDEDGGSAPDEHHQVHRHGGDADGLGTQGQAELPGHHVRPAHGLRQRDAEIALRPQPRLLPPADYSQHPRQGRGTDRRSVPLGQAEKRGGRDLPLGAGGARPADCKRLPLHGQRAGGGEHAREHQRGQQRDSLSGVGGIHCLQGGLQSHLPTAL